MCPSVRRSVSPSVRAIVEICGPLTAPFQRPCLRSQESDDGEEDHGDGDIGNADCIRNQDMVAIVVLIMILFSICVQMAEQR